MNTLFLNDIKSCFDAILDEKCAIPINKNDLSIDYESDLNAQMENYLRLLSEQVTLLSQANGKRNELAMVSALLRLRTHAMNLSTFFDAIVEDAEVILRLDTLPEISEE
ncbi:hypothetical protein [Vagococcus sp. WN89Y]|uniref:hypothetical protein n=1 Tax=Vagococcus sp. WN89Y TaxID=3457258 RepID=UPI003FCD1951